MLEQPSTLPSRSMDSEWWTRLAAIASQSQAAKALPAAVAERGSKQSNKRGLHNDLWGSLLFWLSGSGSSRFELILTRHIR